MGNCEVCSKVVKRVPGKSRAAIQCHDCRALPNRCCEHCGGWFRATRTSQRYCGLSCGTLAYWAKKRLEKVNG